MLALIIDIARHGGPFSPGACIPAAIAAAAASRLLYSDAGLYLSHEFRSDKVAAMSWVTNIMVSALFYDRANVGEFARWLRESPRDYVKPGTWSSEVWEPGEVFGPGEEQPYCGDLAESPHEVWPGVKYNECSVWLGVLNHADLNAIRKRFANIPWRVPNAVQLFLMDQEEFYFRVWMIRDGELRQYAPLKPGENDDDFRPG